MNKIPKPGELYRHYTGGVYQILTVAKHSETEERLVVIQAMSGTFETYASPLSLFISEVDHLKYPRIRQDYWFEQISREQLAQGKTQEEDAAQKSADGGKETGIKGGIKGGINDTGAGEWYAAGQGVKQPEYAAGQDINQPEDTAGQAEKQPEDAPGQVKETRKIMDRPNTRRPAESKRAFREDTEQQSGMDSRYLERRRRQLADRESRREQFLKPQKRKSATDELQANPCLLKFLDADTYEAKYQVLTDIREEMTDRLIDDMAVVLDVVIPEGPLNDRYYQLRNIVLTRQKYEKLRFR